MRVVFEPAEEVVEEEPVSELGKAANLVAKLRPEFDLS